MRDREGEGGLFSCSHEMVAIPPSFPAFISHTVSLIRAPDWLSGSNDWWKVWGGRLYKTGEMRRRWGSFNSLLSFFLSSFFLLAGWVLLSDSSVSQTEFPCSCSSFIPIDHMSGGDGGDGERRTG